MRAARVLVLILAALLALAGCGLGAGPASDEAVQLTVTRDFGQRPVADRKVDDVPESETVMRLLQRNSGDVKTRYGGGFVQCIDRLCGEGSKSVDWFYFVNGSDA